MTEAIGSFVVVPGVSRGRCSLAASVMRGGLNRVTGYFAKRAVRDSVHKISSKNEIPSITSPE